MTRRVLAALAAIAAVCSTSVLAAAPAQANDPFGALTIAKVDEAGGLLTGAKFAGVSCTRWENDLEWQCQPLNEYDWFQPKTAEEIAAIEEEWGEPYKAPKPSLTADGTIGDYFTNDIPLRGGWGNIIQHCVGLQETSAPAGYVPNTQPFLVCLGPGGWNTRNAVGLSMQAKDSDGVPYGPIYTNAGSASVKELGDVEYQGWTLATNVETLGAWTTRSVVDTRTATYECDPDVESDECVPTDKTYEYPYPITYVTLTNKKIATPTPTPTTPTKGRGIGANTGIDG